MQDSRVVDPSQFLLHPLQGNPGAFRHLGWTGTERRPRLYAEVINDAKAASSTETEGENGELCTSTLT